MFINWGAITRRELLTGLAAGSAAWTLAGRAAFSQTRDSRPNIVFIMADDMGYADASCYGRRDFTTPNIDRLAAEGMRFLQGYANSAVCSATRTALITGRYQYRLRVGLEEALANNRDVGLPPDHPTLPSLLRKAGYGTTLIGKWHLGVPPKFGPLKSGYEHFYGHINGAIDYFNHGIGGRGDLWDGDIQVEQHGYLTELLGKQAVKSIENYAHNKQTFLLSLHFNAPHWPWEGPEDEAEAQRILESNIPDAIGHYDGGSLKTYAAMMRSMDEQIGQVLDALEATGLRDNTIVIFTSDNGGERFSDTWPFSGKKTELLEGGLRVPCIASWPARIPKGAVSEQVCMSMDWMPTLLEAAGVSPDPAYPLDGVSLLPTLAGALPPYARKLFWRFKSNSQAAIRDGDWKWLKIRNHTYLFDVAADPLERANLKDRRKDVYDRLVAEWRSWNATMMPLVANSEVHGFSASQLADHLGIED